ncbi:MAG: FG-GAP repeat protein [Chitinophagaceae bacterium]|nr:FG-GAP repeat protein [Chitinophagaceae bacterium]
MVSTDKTDIAADGAANDNYGFAVTMHATTAAVSAPSDDIGANTDQGSVYIYQLTGSVWSLDTKCLATDGTAINKFGYSICMNGAFLIIGSPGVDAAYIIWKLVVWQLVQKLVGSSGTTYGRAVTIFGNYAAVAYTLSGFGGMAGIVKLYFRGALGVWNLQATLNDPYPYVNQIFGEVFRWAQMIW